MSVAAPLAISALPPFEHERKRTSSFSVPHPTKARRTSALQRTPSFLTLPLCDLPTMELYGSPRGAPRPAVSEPHPRSLKRRDPQWSSHALDFQSFVASTAPAAQQQQTPPPSVVRPTPVRAYNTKPAAAPAPVASSSRLPPSPLSGAPRTSPPPAPRPRKKRDSPRRFLPPRERYPAARDEPCLYRAALVQRLRSTPAGAQIVLMGARAALAMLEATAALEQLVAEGDMDLDLSDEDAEGEIDDEPRLGASWIDVRPAEDWEMVDQTATPA